MSDTPTESAAPAKPKDNSVNKIIMGLAAGALVLSLVNTVLLIMNPTAKKVEQFNEELKTDLAESVTSLHRKVDGLKTAEQEWQSVLKKANEKPDAIYKVVNTKDGYLTLTAIDPGSEPAAPETKQ